jgi:hypothetical protein
MRFAKGFGSGFAVVLLCLIIGSLAIGLWAGRSGWGDLQVALGPLAVFSFHRDPRGFATTLGNGILLVALAGGLLNGLGAAWLPRNER